MVKNHLSKMKNQIDLKFSKRSRRGLLILGLLTLLMIYFPRIYFSFLPEEKISIQYFPSEKWESEHQEKQYQDYSNQKYQKKYSKRYCIPPHKFDPNQYTKEEWMHLGLSSKQAEVVLKFTKRTIYSNQDLSKIFVIPTQLFEMIKDSTIYPSKENFEEVLRKDEVVTKKIELNQATEEELLSLKGIGSFFAKQIIKKRTELGGFIKKEQLLEVWKMDQEKYEQLIDQIQLNPQLITKIKLNSITIDELKQHPYVRWNIANSIVKMREQRNGFTNIEDIKKSVLINEELFEKLKPYLSL